ncbi:hypothetical protein [Dyadobacter bucti]|uniref:hypothetical protein n=1 Tax=Dyadobacter bucti TaxID=2572203 RepID=UPI0011095919|nr:hypothetical protein [Dyadobacter bucti]
MYKLLVFLCTTTLLLCSNATGQASSSEDRAAKLSQPAPKENLESKLFEINEKFKLKTAEYISSVDNKQTFIESCKCDGKEEQFIEKIIDLKDEVAKISKWLKSTDKANPKKVVDSLSLQYQSVAEKQLKKNEPYEGIANAYQKAMTDISHEVKNWSTSENKVSDGGSSSENSREGDAPGDDEKSQGELGKWLLANWLVALLMLIVFLLLILLFLKNKSRGRKSNNKHSYKTTNREAVGHSEDPYTLSKEVEATQGNRLATLQVQIRSLETRLEKIELRLDNDSKKTLEHTPRQEEIDVRKTTETSLGVVFPVLYARVVDVGDGFSVDGLSNSKEEEAVFEIMRTTATDATFSVTESRRAQQIALSDPFSYLNDACEYAVIPNSDRIRTQQVGRLTLQHNKWAILEKAKIIFERI